MFVSLNHRIQDANTASISVWNGGFLYGDGVYTTLRLYRGIPLDLEAHWDRLSTQAAALALPLPTNPERLQDTIRELSRANSMTDTDGRMRITIARGGTPDNPLPLAHLAAIESVLLITLVPVPAVLPEWHRDGIAAITLDAGFSRGNIPELKTLNTLPAILALREAARAGCSEALLTATDGRLLEGATSNIFLVRDGALATPAVGAGFLAGLTREKILRLAGELGIDAVESDLDRADLAAADEVFVVGSVREVVPVIRTDGHIVGDGTPGPLTRRIQRGYRALIERLLYEHGSGA